MFPLVCFHLNSTNCWFLYHRMRRFYINTMPCVLQQLRLDELNTFWVTCNFTTRCHYILHTAPLTRLLCEHEGIELLIETVLVLLDTRCVSCPRVCPCQTVVKGRWQPTRPTVTWTSTSSTSICRATESKSGNQTCCILCVSLCVGMWLCFVCVQTELAEEALHRLHHLHRQAGHQGSGEDVRCQSSC